MKKLLLLSFIIINQAFAGVDFEQPYECVVTKSSNPVPVGAKISDLKLSDVATAGLIRTSHGSIFLYSRLNTYHAHVKDSGLIVLATPPTELKEIHGSISVTEEEENKITLEVSVTRTLRAYDTDGRVAFLFRNSLETNTLLCNEK